MNRSLLISVLAGTASDSDIGPRDWEPLLTEARKLRLAARLARVATERGWFERIPLRPRRHLEAALRHCDWQQRVVRWEVGNIERALKAVDTPIVLLKGAAYVMAGLPAARGRIFSDVDVMVRRDRLHDVEGALVAAGWLFSNTDEYDQQYYRKWMHELPPMQHVHRLSVVDVHHTIAPLTSRTPVDSAKLLATARPLEAGAQVWVLAPADMLLHSALHLLQEGEFEHGLRDLFDLDDLFRDFGRDPAFWLGLIERAAEHRLERPLFYAVQQLRDLLLTPMPDAFLEAVSRLRPSFATRRLMGALFRTALTGVPARDELPRIGSARWLLYMRGHYLRMPLPILVPHLLHKGRLRLASALRGGAEDSIPVGGQDPRIN